MEAIFSGRALPENQLNFSVLGSHHIEVYSTRSNEIILTPFICANQIQQENIEQRILCQEEHTVGSRLVLNGVRKRTLNQRVKITFNRRCQKIPLMLYLYVAQIMLLYKRYISLL